MCWRRTRAIAIRISMIWTWAIRVSLMRHQVGQLTEPGTTFVLFTHDFFLLDELQVQAHRATVPKIWSLTCRSTIRCIEFPFKVQKLSEIWSRRYQSVLRFPFVDSRSKAGRSSSWIQAIRRHWGISLCPRRTTYSWQISPTRAYWTTKWWLSIRQRRQRSFSWEFTLLPRTSHSTSTFQPRRLYSISRMTCMRSQGFQWDIRSGLDGPRTRPILQSSQIRALELCTISHCHDTTARTISIAIREFWESFQLCHSMLISSCIFSFRPVEIESDSDVEEYEDAMNADDDIFAEPVQQNRLKTLSEFTLFWNFNLEFTANFYCLLFTLTRSWRQYGR